MPQTQQVTLPLTVSIYSPWMFGIANRALGVGSLTSAAWPAANRAIYVPVRVASTFIVKQLFWHNGSTLTGPPNVDCGLYTLDGTRLVSSGSTAASGTTSIQVVDVTDTTIAPGCYYIGLASDSTNFTVLSLAVGSVNARAVYGQAQESSAFALPAAATMVTNTATYVPFVGMTGETVL